MNFEHLPHPIIFGHRGACAHAPENTLASFELALAHGADAIELDAKLTADRQVVVIHDQTVERTTNGQGRVNQLKLEEIRRLDAGSHFDIAFKGEPVPTLEQILTKVSDRTFTNIELTNYASPNDELPILVGELVKRLGMQDRVMFSSFHPIPLLRAHRQLPEVPVGLLAGAGMSGALARSWVGRLIPHQALHPEVKHTTPSLIQSEHRRGCRVNVWTVNEPDAMRSLFTWDVDGIFTDDPRLARKVLAAAPSRG
jgi:glycerophosphoryl diester phosphodiesterase